MRFVLWIDERILALFTKFSHWFQLLTGRTNYFLAKVCLFLVMSAWVIEGINYWIPVLDEKTYVIEVVLFVVLFFGQVFLVKSLDRAEEDLFSGHKAKKWTGMETSVELRILWVGSVFLLVPAEFHRLTQPSVEGFWLFNFNDALWPIYLIFAFYFAAVNPLPPGKSRVRQFLETVQAGFRKLQPVQRPDR